jgi:hypothetical protein
LVDLGREYDSEADAYWTRISVRCTDAFGLPASQRRPRRHPHRGGRRRRVRCAPNCIRVGRLSLWVLSLSDQQRHLGGRREYVPRFISSPSRSSAGFQNRRVQVLRRIGRPAGAGKITASGYSHRASVSAVSSSATKRGSTTLRRLFGVLGGPTTTRPLTSEAVRRTRS